MTLEDTRWGDTLHFFGGGFPKCSNFSTFSESLCSYTGSFYITIYLISGECLSQLYTSCLGVKYHHLVAGSYLPLVQLLRRRWPQADKTIVFDYSAGTLAWRCEPFHLRHIVQALLDVAKVAGFGWRFVIWVRVSTIVTLLVLTGPAVQAAIQAPTLLSQLYLTLWIIRNIALQMGWRLTERQQKLRWLTELVFFLS